MGRYYKMFSKNRHINAIKSKITIEFAEYLIENAINDFDKSFDALVLSFGKNPFSEMKQSTFRSYFSTLRFLMKRKSFSHTSILPYWFSALWDKECFNRGLQCPKLEEIEEQAHKIDYENARMFLKEFKEKTKESSTTVMPVYQTINWMIAFASNNEI